MIYSGENNSMNSQDLKTLAKIAIRNKDNPFGKKLAKILHASFSSKDEQKAMKIYNGSYYGKKPTNAIKELMFAMNIFKQMNDIEKMKEMERILESYQNR